jgi:hypothetical protein
MSTFVESAVESGRSHPSGTPPSLVEYRFLFERIKREADLAREDARRRAHERVWELARQQGVEPIRSIKELQGDFWPEEESIDDFLSWLRATRQEDKARDIPE